MKSLFFLIVSMFACTIAMVCHAEEPPAGEVQQYKFEGSKVFPGTVRDYWVYVPKQYEPSQPACVFVCQDGLQYNAPKVFDQLIASKEMPVTIGVFVMHGRVKALSDQAIDRFNRSFEYDGLGDNYARFILDELLPEVETKKTSDGRAIHLSQKGSDRCIAGNSSGAICAFTAAWERPDAFGRVFSAIGTYVGLRGGHSYSTLVRKTEPKPLRVFLEDGSNDLNIYGGDWWMANQAMERSLSFAGYEVNHVWGEGQHNAQHATEIFPDAMRWMWKDWPAAPKAGLGSSQLQEILIPGEDWRLVGEGYAFTEGPTANAQGELFFNDVGKRVTYKVADGETPQVFMADNHGCDGQAFGPDGKLVAAVPAQGEVRAYDEAGKFTSLGKLHGNDVVVNHNGDAYITSPESGKPSKVYYIPKGGEPRVVDEGLKFANGIALSPDHSLLYVADSHTHWVYSFQVQPNGDLAHKQKYYHIHAPDTADDAGADGLCVDRDGRLYVATRMGVQICDQAGRVNCIIPTPNRRLANLRFGGKDFDLLYAMCGDKVYVRKLKTKGIAGFEQPIKPREPRL